MMWNGVSWLSERVGSRMVFLSVLSLVISYAWAVEGAFRVCLGQVCMNIHIWDVFGRLIIKGVSIPWFACSALLVWLEIGFDQFKPIVILVFSGWKIVWDRLFLWRGEEQEGVHGFWCMYLCCKSSFYFVLLPGTSAGRKLQGAVFSGLSIFFFSRGKGMGDELWRGA